MGQIGTFTAVLGAAALLAATPAPAQAEEQQAAGEATYNAEQLRRLDIMLMVMELHCRRTSDAFGHHYDVFAANHRHTMNAASHQLRESYAAGRSERTQRRMLDTLSTSMANRYGVGHPWLECAEIGEIVVELAQAPDATALIVAADELLADEPPVRIAMEAVWVER